MYDTTGMSTIYTDADVEHGAKASLEDNAHEIRLLPVASLSFTSIEIMVTHEHPTNELDKHLYAQRKSDAC
jgi:hypothetical protein